jgi:hypothetical protein
MANENAVIECPICMCPMQLSIGSLSDCEHIFDWDCIRVWLESCSKCPICKQETSYAARHVLTSPLRGEGLSISHAYNALPAAVERECVEAKSLRSDDHETEAAVAAHANFHICEGMSTILLMTAESRGHPFRARTAHSLAFSHEANLARHRQRYHAKLTGFEISCRRISGGKSLWGESGDNFALFLKMLPLPLNMQLRLN